MAFAQGRTSAYPGAKVRAPRKPMRVAFAWVTHRGAVLLEQRSLDGLWPGLWELPSACGTRAKADLGLRLGQPLGACLVQIAHTLTHRDVTARVYRATRPKATTKRQGQKWWRDPLSAPLSSLARKAIVAVQRTQILAA
jgi:adenine-specific DNA glycosylase